MTPENVVNLIANLGFPIGVAIFLLIAIPKLTDEIRDMKAKLDTLIRLQEYQSGLRRREDV